MENKKLLYQRKWHDKNREAVRKYQKEYREKNKEKIKAWAREYQRTVYKHKIRAQHIKKKYGLSLEEVNFLLEKQNNSCAICKRDLTFTTHKKADTAHIDHCHETGQVRGALCIQCNLGLGAFKDREDLLLTAIEYLRGVVHT